MRSDQGEERETPLELRHVLDQRRLRWRGRAVSKQARFHGNQGSSAMPRLTWGREGAGARLMSF